MSLGVRIASSDITESSHNTRRSKVEEKVSVPPKRWWVWVGVMCVTLCVTLCVWVVCGCPGGVADPTQARLTLGEPRECYYVVLRTVQCNAIVPGEHERVTNNTLCTWTP